MIKKFVRSVIHSCAYGFLGLSAAAFADAPVETKSANKASAKTASIKQNADRIQQLEKEIDRLKAEKKSDSKESDSKESTHNWDSHLRVGPYFIKDATFSGGNLLVRQLDERMAAALLLEQVRLNNEFKENGYSGFPYPQVLLSGRIQGFYQFSSPYEGDSRSEIQLPGIELNMQVVVSPWVMGYAEIRYRPDGDDEDGKLYLNRAMAIFGNLEKFPLYAVIGKDYLDFGRYGSYLVTSTLPQLLGESIGRKVQVGYQQQGDNKLHASAYIFESKSDAANLDGQPWGADLGYRFKISEKVSGEVGGGYISTITNSGSIINVVGTGNRLTDELPAVNVHGSLTFSPIQVVAEYTTAVKDFKAPQLFIDGIGAKPSAYNVQAGYNFEVAGRPMSLSGSFGGTKNGAALLLPKYSAAAVLNISIFRHTLLAIEYRRDYNYSIDDFANIKNKPSNYSYGKADNAVNVQLDVYF